MNKQEILRKHLGQTPAQFQDSGKKNTLDAMEEYAELYHQNKVKYLGLSSVSNSVCKHNWISSVSYKGAMICSKCGIYK